MCWPVRGNPVFEWSNLTSFVEEPLARHAVVVWQALHGIASVKVRAPSAVGRRAGAAEALGTATGAGTEAGADVAAADDATDAAGAGMVGPARATGATPKTRRAIPSASRVSARLTCDLAVRAGSRDRTCNRTRGRASELSALSRAL